MGIGDEYSSVAEQDILILLPFVTTYRREVGFSAYFYTKIESRNRLVATSDLQIQSHFILFSQI